MEIDYFIGSEVDIDRLMNILKSRLKCTLLGYRARGNEVTWDEVNSTRDLPLELEDFVKPGVFKTTPGSRFRHSWISPKLYLYPPEQEFISESSDFEYSEVLLKPGEDTVVFFGIKPCDLAAIEILDKILLDKHPVYTVKRSRLVGIVVEECLKPNENCFCGLTGSGPIVNRGFDIAYARLRKDIVLFKYGSKLGEEVIGELGLSVASRDITEEYRYLVKNTVEETKRGIVLDIKYLRKLLPEVAKDISLWEKLSEKCIGCGNCNYVCPTCFCVEFEYSIRRDRLAYKKAKWTGCLLRSYGLVAREHHRPELYMRYRHFILHKFIFYQVQIGQIGCTGCGRCITWCPMGIDIRESIKTTMTRGEVYVRVDKST